MRSSKSPEQSLEKYAKLLSKANKALKLYKWESLDKSMFSNIALLKNEEGKELAEVNLYHGTARIHSIDLFMSIPSSVEPKLLLPIVEKAVGAT